MKQIILIATLMASVAGFSQQNNKQYLDSVVSPALFKEVFSYDKNGNTTMKARYKWENNAWSGSWKYEHAYNADNNLVLGIDYSWDTIKNDWINSYKTEYTFYKIENQTEEINYSWDAVKNEWIPNDRYSHSYDINGNLLGDLYYSWDAEKNEWLIFFSRQCLYDINGNLIYKEEYSRGGE